MYNILALSTAQGSFFCFYIYMKNLLLKILFLTISVFVFGQVWTTNTVKADAGFPATITASYNQTTGELNTSGSYVWEECEPGEETNILGFALFINGGNPATNDENALDGGGMHLINGGNPCEITPGNWGDSHILTTAPTNVCVVVYDVRADDSADPEGNHSLIGAGGNYNTDNSWDLNEDSYPEASCTTPEILTSTPTPFVTPNCTGDSHLDASGKNCVSFQLGGPSQSSGTSGGQVLGASTMAATGSFAETFYQAIMGLGGIFTVKGLKKVKKASKKA